MQPACPAQRHRPVRLKPLIRLAEFGPARAFPKQSGRNRCRAIGHSSGTRTGRPRLDSPQRFPWEAVGPWYDTPNIRVGTHADFEVLARKDGRTNLDSFGIQDGRIVRCWPNLLASVAVLEFERG